MSEQKPTITKPENKESGETLLEGKYVAVSYQSSEEFEYINTLLIYKIVKGKATRVFGVLDFPGYQSTGELEANLFKEILDCIKDEGIEELYFLTEWENTFGIEFKNEQIGETLYEIHPTPGTGDIQNLLEKEEVIFKYYDPVKDKTLD